MNCAWPMAARLKSTGRLITQVNNSTFTFSVRVVFGLTFPVVRAEKRSKIYSSSTPQADS